MIRKQASLGSYRAQKNQSHAAIGFRVLFFFYRQSVKTSVPKLIDKLANDQA